MSKLKPFGTNGQLSVLGATAGWISLHTYAWNITDCGELWLFGPKRAQNVLIPGVAGRLGRPRNPDEASYSLPFLVTGDCDPLGVKPGANTILDREKQLETTLAYLNAQLTATPSTDDGTRPARLTMPSGTIRTADIQVMSITFVQNLATGSSRAYTFDLTIPDGRFV